MINYFQYFEDILNFQTSLIFRGHPRRENNPRGKKDVVYTALVANGTVSELYIEIQNGGDIKGDDFFVHVVPPMKGLKKNGTGRGEIGMLDWCSHQHSRGFFSNGDVRMIFLIYASCHFHIYFHFRFSFLNLYSINSTSAC